jgi:hypothetical protein
MISRMVFAVAFVLAVAGSLLAGAPADTSVSGCHGRKSCHGEDQAQADVPSCHGAAVASCHGEEPESGCHGRASRTHRRAARVQCRASSRAARAESRATRAGLKASAASCHGEAEAAKECDCGDACDCR